MNQEIKDGWISDLTSGEYPQGEGRLKDNAGRFCCLGVLCERARKAGIVRLEQVDWDSTINVYVSVENPDDRSWTGLPMAVARWAQLPEIDGFHPGSPRIGNEFLTNLNDNGVPFTEIAELIREHL